MRTRRQFGYSSPPAVCTIVYPSAPSVSFARFSGTNIMSASSNRPYVSLRSQPVFFRYVCAFLKLTVRLYPKSRQGSVVKQPSCSRRNSVAISQEESVDPVSQIQYAETRSFTALRHRRRIFSSFRIINTRTNFGICVGLMKLIDSHVNK